MFGVSSAAFGGRGEFSGSDRGRGSSARAAGAGQVGDDPSVRALKAHALSH